MKLTWRKHVRICLFLSQLAACNKEFAHGPSFPALQHLLDTMKKEGLCMYGMSASTVSRRADARFAKFKCRAIALGRRYTRQLALLGPRGDLGRFHSMIVDRQQCLRVETCVFCVCHICIPRSKFFVGQLLFSLSGTKDDIFSQAKADMLLSLASRTLRHGA